MAGGSAGLFHPPHPVGRLGCSRPLTETFGGTEGGRGGGSGGRRWRLVDGVLPEAVDGGADVRVRQPGRAEQPDALVMDPAAVAHEPLPDAQPGEPGPVFLLVQLRRLVVGLLRGSVRREERAAVADIMPPISWSAGASTWYHACHGAFERTR